jgi:glycosyltransferase involved in cell wall biosynthesis
VIRSMQLLFLSLYFRPAVRYGGPAASTWALCSGLAARGFAVRALTTDADGDERLRVRPGWHEQAPNLSVRYYRRRRGEFFAPGLLAALPREVARADVVYVWGILVWPLPALALLSRLAGRPLVISPRGMLFPEALAAGGRKKRLFLAALAAAGAARATFHVTSEREAAAVRAHFPAARVLEIPNGVEIPPALPRRAGDEVPYLLFLGRLHPHKQIETILAAFAAWSRDAGQPAELRIAGGGEEGYRESLRDLARRLDVAARVRFLHHVEGEEKSRLLAGAEGLILASRSENFGLSVAEALAHGTPCVVTETAPWAEIERGGCGFWVADRPEALAAGIARLMALPAVERRAMGERGRAWMRRDFSDERVADRMAAALAALAVPGGGGASEDGAQLFEPAGRVREHHPQPSPPSAPR